MRKRFGGSDIGAAHGCGRDLCRHVGNLWGGVSSPRDRSTSFFLRPPLPPPHRPPLPPPRRLPLPSPHHPSSPLRHSSLSCPAGSPSVSPNPTSPFSPSAHEAQRHPRSWAGTCRLATTCSQPPRSTLPSPFPPIRHRTLEPPLLGPTSPLQASPFPHPSAAILLRPGRFCRLPLLV
ncbi:hypothetical protein C8J57DRAFT_1505561 [Mycena rebaudengoi]|nr:hypothetical protein C8J57DRAFT_1505561 [Mycena rebaudengoi]